jgi:excisionase family DNA binding protein
MPAVEDQVTSSAPIAIDRNTPYEMLPQMMRAHEAAARAGITLWTIYSLCRQNKIPQRRLGKSILIPREFFKVTQ